MQAVDASPDQVRQAEAHILPAFRKSLDEVLRDRQDPRPVPADDRTTSSKGDVMEASGSRSQAPRGHVCGLAGTAGLAVESVRQQVVVSVVARGLGRPAVCGATAVRIHKAGGTVTSDGQSLAEGELISVDGSRGIIYTGAVHVVPGFLV